MEASKKGKNWKEGKQLFQTVASFEEKITTEKVRQWKCTTSSILSLFSSSFSSSPPFSLSFSIVHTLPSPTSLLFLLFQANGTSRDLETSRHSVCLPASQPVQIQVVRRSAPSAATTESSFSLAVLQICVLSCAFLLLHRYATAAAAMTTCTSKQQQQRCNPPS